VQADAHFPAIRAERSKLLSPLLCNLIMSQCTIRSARYEYRMAKVLGYGRQFEVAAFPHQQAVQPWFLDHVSSPS
jgi:hypothetical protein